MEDKLLLLKDHLSKIHNQNSFVELLQIEVVELAEGIAKLTMPITKAKHTNLYNIAHGGVLASLADTAMGVACATTGQKVLTLDMNMNFIRPVEPEQIISALSRVIHNGKHTMVAETDIIDDQHNLLLKARATFFVVGTFI